MVKKFTLVLVRSVIEDPPCCPYLNFLELNDLKIKLLEANLKSMKSNESRKLMMGQGPREKDCGIVI